MQTLLNKGHTPVMLLQGSHEAVQVAAASLLGRLQVQPLHGPRVTLTLRRLLPPGLVAAIQASMWATGS